MLTLDGSHGEGGGQILRSALALAATTGQAFRIERIRSNRKKGGLMRQHLTAVRAARTICDARVDGETIGSTELSFQPGAVAGGNYRFAIGTAGSATLVLQTILSALLTANEPSRIVLEGGTHNPHSPPFDFLQRSFLPLVEAMGPRVTSRLERHGFFPAGGGRFVVEVEPVDQLKPLHLEGGADKGGKGRILLAHLPRHIAEREAKILGKKTGWGEDRIEIVEIQESDGPGNIVMIEVDGEQTNQTFVGFGELRTRAEAVAQRAITAWRRWRKADVPVGEYLADQLLLPMALAGEGSFRTLPLSRHSDTQIHLLQQFLDVPISVEQDSPASVRVRVGCGVHI